MGLLPNRPIFSNPDEMYTSLAHGVQKNMGEPRPVWYFRFRVPELKGKTAFEED